MKRKMIKNRICSILITAITIGMVFSGCGKPEALDGSDSTQEVVQSKEDADSTNASQTDPTDYSQADAWYKLPDETAKDVDTFFIYPTLYSDFGEEATDYAGLHEEMVMEKIDSIYLTQASVFEESTNLYIPFYRQANITIETEAAFDSGDIEPVLKDNLPEIDINAALDYYFEHYNEGRPFIIAGHSQGSAMTRLVLKDYFAAHPDYYGRMVAAYVIGYSVTQQDLDENPHLKFARGADDTGVIVSWNTEGEGNAGQKNIVVVDGGISINPLNWKRDETHATAEENLGSLIIDQATGEAHFEDVGADAQVDTGRGVVISHADYPFISGTDPDEKAGALRETAFGTESFHNGDYTLFYNNIKENVKQRIASFMEEASDYSIQDNWLHLPDEAAKRVDTIYLYPTAIMDASEGAPEICEIDNESMRTMAKGFYEGQAVVYDESTNVYAPYYRQVNLAAVTGLSTEERDALSSSTPQTDVFAALDYYFENYNGGRPFILAGHSQGSQMLTNVLGKYMKDHEDYLKRMVAAYVIGYSVTDEFLAEHPYLTFAEGETDTGVIVSWNTEGEGNKDQDSFVILPGAKCINPLNWVTDEAYAPATLNLGGRIMNSDSGEYETVPEAADAQIYPERGVIITTTTAINPVAAEGFGTDSFHNGDYSLFYYNLQENVEKRIEAFFSKNKK